MVAFEDGMHDGKRNQKQDPYPDQQKNQVLELDSSIVLLLGSQKELHCRPPDNLKPAPVQQVNNDRGRRDGRAPEQGWIQKSNWHR